MDELQVKIELRLYRRQQKRDKLQVKIERRLCRRQQERDVLEMKIEKRVTAHVQDPSPRLASRPSYHLSPPCWLVRKAPPRTSSRRFGCKPTPRLTQGQLLTFPRPSCFPNSTGTLKVLDVVAVISKALRIIAGALKALESVTGILKAQPPQLQHPPSLQERWGAAEGAKALGRRGVHKDTQTGFHHIKVVLNPPDVSPLLQRCLARALENMVAATAPVPSSLLQDPNPWLTSWLVHLPRAVCLPSCPLRLSLILRRWP